MKRVIATAGALAFTAGAATAGGVERSVTTPNILFEEGNYVELSFGHASPSVSGTQAIPVGPFPLGASTGDMAESYNTVSLGVKTQLNDRLDLSVVFDQPIGANVNYGAGTGYVYGGSTAEITSRAFTGLLRYRLNDSFSVYGGLKLQSAKGEVALFNGYRMNTSTESDVGYVVGAAFEKPEIAMRVALTYVSSITHDFDATETTALGVLNTTFETEVPQSLSLDAQTGIAKDTLLFGSIRWRDWTAFDITPVAYNAATNDSLVDYNDDTITYTLGIGRRFNENWSGAVQIAHEPQNGGFAGNLGPTDGYTSLGVGVTYTRDNMKITGGVSYAKIGNARTEAPAAIGAPPGTTLGDFRDNDLLGFGLRIGFSF